MRSPSPVSRPLLSCPSPAHTDSSLDFNLNPDSILEYYKSALRAISKPSKVKFTSGTTKVHKLKQDPMQVHVIATLLSAKVIRCKNVISTLPVIGAACK